MKLPGLEAACLAAIARDATRMAVDELLDQLDVAALLGRGREHRSLEELVEPQQRRVAPKLLAHKLIRRLGSLALELPGPGRLRTSCRKRTTPNTGWMVVSHSHSEPKKARVAGSSVYAR